MNCLNRLLTLQWNEQCGVMWLCGSVRRSIEKNAVRNYQLRPQAQLPFKHLDNFVCLFRGSKLKDPTHPEKKHVMDSLVVSFSKLPLT